MSFGLKVISESGEDLFSEDTLVNIGRFVSYPVGTTTFTANDRFVGIGAYGVDLVKNSLFWARSGNTITVTIGARTSTAPMRCVLFEEQAESTSEGGFGLEVYDSKNTKIFSTNDIHFKTEGQFPIPPKDGKFSTTGVAAGPKGTIYLLHSSFNYFCLIYWVPAGPGTPSGDYYTKYSGPYGMAIGVDDPNYIIAVDYNTRPDNYIRSYYAWEDLVPPVVGYIQFIKGRARDDE